MMIDTLTKDKLTNIFARFKGTKDELIQIMESAQDEFGYLPAELC